MRLCTFVSRKYQTVTTTVVTSPWIAAGKRVTRTHGIETNSTCKGQRQAGCQDGCREIHEARSRYRTTSQTGSAEQLSTPGTEGVKGEWTSTTVTEYDETITVYECCHHSRSAADTPHGNSGRETAPSDAGPHKRKRSMK